MRKLILAIVAAMGLMGTASTAHAYRYWGGYYGAPYGYSTYYRAPRPYAYSGYYGGNPGYSYGGYPYYSGYGGYYGYPGYNYSYYPGSYGYTGFSYGPPRFWRGGYW